MKIKCDIGADRLYTYDSGDLEVQIGDRVLVEGNQFTNGVPFIAVVKELTSDYEGPLKRILDIVSDLESEWQAAPHLTMAEYAESSMEADAEVYEWLQGQKDY